uniref:Glycosyl transferase 48 domain-containing protein n=1 Tax=Arundo donax TaxID=35708 RepID=A0A0A8YPE2_ARUDO
MYYERVLELLAFLDTAQEIDPMEGYRAAETQCKTLSDLKFTYVISCQQYGIQKLQHDACAKEISELMKRYPSLRVAYVDEDEVPRQDSTRKAKKVYYSVLAKASPTGHDQVIYRIKLPGNPILGEGKPENQNHAIIFTRGECLQTIDMNQEHYMEEAFKMRNLLHEFEKRDGARNPSILGVRENIFTGSVSTLAWFMSKQETSFVTLSQRVLAKPLRVRFHYGHPDVFDRLFHLTRGGVSKASKTINLSEDVFGGFNSTLREGNVTYCEYVQVGKGRDVGINQLTLFEAKVANGNGEQTLSRDIYRLGHHFDFFRMLSCYYTTVGFYFSAMITVWALYAFLYGRLYLVLSGIDELLATGESFIHNGPLQISLNSPAFVQLGFLTALPMLMEMCVGDGCGSALREFLHMQLQFASVFFSFSLGTKVHYYGTTLLHGGAQYRATGRGFVVSHVKFAENYRLYCRSHFVKGIELMTLLVVDLIMGQPYRARILYNFITIYMWFLAISWLSAPFIFNPCGFDWQKIVDDWADWRMWMNHRGGIGVPPAKSWVSWWREEQKPLQQCGRRGNIVEFLLAMRFFLCQYGLVYHLDIVKNITNESHNILVYFMSLVIFFTILLIMKAVSAARRHSSARFQRALRLIKGSLFLALLIIVILLMASFGMTALDILLCILAFIQTSRGVLLVAQAISPVFKRLCLWKLVEDLAWGYDSLTGGLLFSAVAILAWFPAVSDFQTRLLFNQAFSRGLHISRILHKTTK